MKKLLALLLSALLLFSVTACANTDDAAEGPVESPAVEDSADDASAIEDTADDASAAEEPAETDQVVEEPADDGTVEE